MAAKADEIEDADPDAADICNLFRVHWHNGAERRSLVDVPQHLELPEALTGVKARIIMALGNRFPMINADKVLAAYGCLIPHLISGAFDVTRHRAVWPSTGNYCRGGVAIAKLLGCRSVAVLPEGMSRKRCNWLEEWVVDPKDIHRTPGTESNVKEIYDACHSLAKDKQNLILNQFAEYGNYIVHRAVTGGAMYQSEIEIAKAKYIAGKFSEIEAAEAFGQHLLGAGIDHVSELTHFDRERIFNLGYYIWVEQQGTSLTEFDRWREQEFWDGLMNWCPSGMI